MASVSVCSTTANFIKLGFHEIPNSSSIILHSTPIFRFKNAATLVTGRRLPLVHVSNKPSGEIVGKTEAVTSSDTSTAAPGPPFLTILAGIVAFALVLWVIGSFVSWLIGLLGLVFSK